MSHRVIIIDIVSPSGASDAEGFADTSEPEFRIKVEYRPKHSLTSSQIGNEIARISRKLDQIIDAEPS